MKKYICPKCGANCKPEEIIEEGVLCVNCKYEGVDLIDIRRPTYCLKG